MTQEALTTRSGTPKVGCHLPYGPNPAGIPEALEAAIPLAVFKAELAAWAKRIGVNPREVHIRAMKRKWASCSTRGRVTFDRALLQQPATFRAEVIAHELLHLKIPNHGKVFKRLLATYLSESHSRTHGKRTSDVSRTR